MQAHNADYVTKMEAGVINNYNKEVQNVNTGNNYGMYNLHLMFKIFSSISIGLLIQNVNNQGV